MASTPSTQNGPRHRSASRTVLLLAAAVTAMVGGALLAAPAHAAPPAGTGWVRVGHLSPDTKAVDVTLTALAGGQTAYQLDDVTYGQVSPYKQMPSGTYSVAMTPSGAAKTAKPIISASVTIAPNKPITVVAYGTNKDLKTTVFEDDLTKPTVGQARVRLVQAATVASTVNVSTSTGTPIAKDAPFGSASGYASVPAGPWKLELTAKKLTSSVDVTLASGSVSTLFVLDNSSGGITLVPVVDSAATTTTPVGGVQTGGGFEAVHPAYSRFAAVKPFAELVH